MPVFYDQITRMPPVGLTIASGVLNAVDAETISVTVETGSSDDLDTISNMVAGRTYTLYAADAAATVVVRDASVNSGNIYTQAQQSISLAEATDCVQIRAITVSGSVVGIVVGFRTQAESSISDLYVAKGGDTLSTASATFLMSGSSGSAMNLTIDAVNSGASTGNLILTADDAVKVGDAGNPAIDLPGSGAVTATGNPTWNTGTNTFTVGGTLDSNNQIDHDAALTGTGDGMNSLVTISHATQSAEAHDVTIQQITNARTAGTAAALQATAIGLAGDTSGATYTALNIAAPTANGGSAIYTGLIFGTGWTNIIDVSAMATGQARIKIGDNLANAFEVIEGSASYLKAVTADGSESLASGVRLTTTDGVASGTVRVVGGRAYSNTAAGTSLTNSTSETVLGSYSIPANTLKSGSVVSFRAKVKVTANNGATTLTLKGRIGDTTLTGTAFFTGAATDTAANNVAYATGAFISRADPGASVAVEGMGTYSDPAAAGSGVLKDWSLDATNFATNGALLLEITGTWSAADANAVQLEHLDVRID